MSLTSYKKNITYCYLFFVFVEVKRFYKFDLYINLTLQLFYYFTTHFYADFESPFPHDKNRDI